jgi:ribosome-binding factor A
LKLNEDILNKASGHLRKIIADKLSLRKVPRLKFFIDDTLDYYNHINSIINKINNENPPKNNEE